jgi:hypothetical protein
MDGLAGLAAGPPPAADGLAGLAAGPPPGAPPSIQIGGPDQGGPPDQGGGLPDDPVGLMQGAIDHLSKYLDVEPDDGDKLVAAKALTALQGLLAKDQKEQEAASGTTPAMKGMSKALLARGG